ncbi:MAG: DNA cytosine methyltransferase [Propionibacteriaceae bacterium]|nr:DNA cytosine methyltransferase [Propionibacteriaceae bacterium]
MSPFTRQLHSGLDVTDFFCGIGGSSSGLVAAGWDVKLAANHDQTAINTHSANHPNTEHICADLQTVDYRYLPPTRALWASPICTEVSPAGGRRKRKDGPSLWEEHGHVPDAAFERTRVTFWEVLRACEVHAYEVVMLENVLEAFDWELLPVFLAGMETLGYEIQTVCVSAAHVGGTDNPNAPQLRDRIYWVCRRHGMKPFDLDLRPPAWCDECDAIVDAVQWWKPATKAARSWKGQRAGKYGAQYLWVCPVGNHGRVEPLIMPAAAAIDWTNLGVRIGDRAALGMRDLARSTLNRVGMGLEMISNPALIAAAGNTYDAASGSGNRYLRAINPHGKPMPTQTTTAQQAITMTSDEAAKFVMAVNHTGDSPRAFDPDHRPLPTRSTKNGEALVMTEPFITMLRENGKPTPVYGAPLQAFTTGRNHGLTIPPGAFITKNHAGFNTGQARLNKPVTEPMPTVRAHGQHSLVVPYRRGSRPHSPSEALSTIATREQHGLMTSGHSIDIDDCYFRMLTPRESANAQRFERDYKLTGTLGEQQMGAGNAVPVNVAQWIGAIVAEGLDAA